MKMKMEIELEMKMKKMKQRIEKKMKYLSYSKIQLFLLILIVVPVVIAIPTMRIDVFVFHAETCPACVQMMEFLEGASQDYPTMVIHVYNIRDEESKRLYDLFKEVYALDIQGRPIPMVFIGKDTFGGYTATNLKLMEKKLGGCLKEGCTIALTPEQDCIVIIDPTPTPELMTTSFLLPFLVAAGIICCVTPYNADMVTKIRTWKSVLFFLGYLVTSMLLCFALLNVVFMLDAVILLNLPLVLLAVILGVLAVLSVKAKILKAPHFASNAMDQLAEDQSGFSLFCLGIGACVISMLYTVGIYLMVVYRMLFFSFTDRFVHFAVFNVSLLAVLILLYMVAPQKKNLFYVLVGAGSIALGIVYWMVW